MLKIGSDCIFEREKAESRRTNCKTKAEELKSEKVNFKGKMARLSGDKKKDGIKVVAKNESKKKEKNINKSKERLSLRKVGSSELKSSKRV